MFDWKKIANICIGIGFVFSLAACSNSGGDSSEFKGVEYIGKGVMESMVNVAVHGPDQMLFLEAVKVVDDQPTVRKVLEAVEQHRGISMEFDRNGRITQVNDQKNDEQSRWTLLIDNVVVDQDINELKVEDDQNITVLYDDSEGKAN